MKLILPSKKNEQGQVLLVLLLVISVILVVGLSVVSRSVTDIKISQQSQESARALLVAQTGLEKAIKANSLINNESVSGIGYSVTKDDLGGIGKKTFIFPNPISANDFANVWLVDHDSSGNLTIPNPQVKNIIFTWGNESSTEKTALEATLIYKNASGQFANVRYVFDPDPGAHDTHFEQVSTGCTIDLINFPYCSQPQPINLPGTPYLIRFRLFFNTTPQKIGVKSDDNDLPVQGSCYVSTATVQESKVTRRLQQCQLWPTVPSIFNYQLFSGGSLE